jgi:hypothetical protein
MGGPAGGNKRATRALTCMRSKAMQDGEKVSTGPNAEPLDENIGTTAEGISDDSLAPGEEEILKAPTDEEVEKAAEALGATQAEKDTLPLYGE